MKQLGPPEIVVFEVSENVFIAPEGVHRLTVAKLLDLPPKLQLPRKEHFDLQWQEIRPSEIEGLDEILELTVGEMCESTKEHLRTNFHELPRLIFREYILAPWMP